MKTRSNNIALPQIVVLLALFTMSSACTTTSGNGESNEFGPPFVPKGALDDRVTLKNAAIKRSALNPEATQLLSSGSILSRSPLELVGAGNNLTLAQFATKINVVAYVRKDGEGILASLKKEGATVAPGFTMGRRIIYPNRESAQKDFPHIAPDTLDKFIQIENSQIILTKWELSLYWIQSRDGRAFRLFLDQPRYLNHINPDAAESDTADNGPPSNSGNALAVFSYRYPVHKQGQLHNTSVIFDLTIDTSKETYWGTRQSSGWLPLQPNTKNGPYSIQVGIIEASNIQSFFERIGGAAGISGKLIGKVF